jgi:2-polyprenyl-3-methyl-5-hydroxy-6-metoxy-1,4-benzoquinol methylase
MEQLDRCNLCDGTHFSLFAELMGETVRKPFRVVRCEGCGLLFVSPRLTAEENLALYDEAYFNGKGFDGTVNYAQVDAHAELREGENGGVIDKIRALKPHRDIRILDVGCGSGSLLRALDTAGYNDVSGIELSEYASCLARQGTRAQVWTGDILTAPLAAGTIDVINATEVIEHLRDPLAFFQRVKELLKPGGVFLYSTGNARGIYARVLGKRWPYLHPEGHLFYYSPQTLVRYFERVNLRPLDMSALDRVTREAIQSADDRIAHSQLCYIGPNERGLKKTVSGWLARLDTPIVMRAWSLVLGKCHLPIAVNA